MSHRKIGLLPKIDREKFKATQAALGLVGIKVTQNDYVEWSEDQNRQAYRWARAFHDNPKTTMARPPFVPAPDLQHGWR